VLNSELPLDHGYFEYAKKNHATALLISGVSGIQQEENLDAKLKELGYTKVQVLGKDGFTPCAL
jgi:hypothetical protein